MTLCDELPGMAIILALTIFAAGSAPPPPHNDSIPTDKICSASGAPFVGPCFTVHGRMTLGADNIVVRIWRIGTRRILGYADGALRCAFPVEIMDLLERGKQVYADIIVRPVTESRPGFMQFVCVASASMIVTRDAY